ncbi:hypothetical protein ONZ45_g9944 [Pleurotus djamor]|nr:hypothetical protein ONZ45_g9944 [Pleurotus djamor]
METNTDSAAIIGSDADLASQWHSFRHRSHIDSTKYSPFASEMEWKLAEWFIEEDIGHGSFKRLLKIPDLQNKLGLQYSTTRDLHKLVDSLPCRAGSWETAELTFEDSSDVHFIWYRDPLEALRSLWQDPTLAEDFTYQPCKVYNDKHRVYNEMWTGDWWHNVQAKLPKGACLAPIIIATDKTQLTQFSGSKAAYPVYMTLGNIAKSVRQKPSRNACVLLGYLSADKVDGSGLSDKELRLRTKQLFHSGIRIMLESLMALGKEGVELSDAMGRIRKVHPILAAYVADYPEQCLVCCAKYTSCPKCRTEKDSLGDGPKPGTLRTQAWTLKMIQCDANQADSSFLAHCKKFNVSPMLDNDLPFWHDFYLADIHQSTTPDVLHQLYQGVFKHVLEWCQAMMNKKCLDQRIRTLPPAFGVRHFNNGISALSQITGPERKDIARILLACLVGDFPQDALRSVKALLDFIYLAQYRSHDDETLKLLSNSLKDFHKYKAIFKALGCREDFNIPKLYSLSHYVASIKLFGTTDNYNTETFEHLHIEFAKKGWRASNKRDTFPQMVKWLNRHEKMTMHRTSIAYSSTDPPHQTPRRPKLSLAKKPTHMKSLEDLMAQHGCPQFEAHLQKFLDPRNNSRTQTPLPLSRQHLPIWHSYKISRQDIDDKYGEGDTKDIIRAIPSQDGAPNVFTPVIVMVNEEAEETALYGTRAGRVRIVFKLPDEVGQDENPHLKDVFDTCSQGLAYIQWYSKFPTQQVNSHGMIRVKPTESYSVVPLENIRQSCMLTPNFPADFSASLKWNSEEVLDQAPSFYLNPWTSLYSYKTLY